ncbi:MAG TPA: hypothetical protein VL463_28390 [Kofleriaceae bacterium]|nr:hypothetical protein [Kofleriaceae bacterium]
MAAKRSPILGYNHNVRFRGVVFHVQTEDSGLQNPHVFTHLFHGGVILSTRKLVYDPDASEEAVKALMQSQHKAVLRDLKNGSFDDKIDLYLGGTPGLLPRGTEDNGVSTRAQTHDDVAMSRAATESMKDDAPTPPPPSRSKTASVPPPAHKGPAGSMPAIPVRTQPGNPVPPPVPAPITRTTQPRSSMTPPPVVSRPMAEEVSQSERREVSQAFKAMQMPEDLDVAEVHSPAPPTTPLPQGAAPERPGEYSQHKKPRESGPMAPIPHARRDSVPPPIAGAPSGPPPRAQPPVVRARPPTPGPRAPTVPGPPQPQRFPNMVQPGQPAVPRAVTPPAVARTATPATQPPRPRAPSGGGVVMSKPAVIVGAPPKVIGGGSGSGPVPAQPRAAVAAAAPSGRVRKAREDSEGGMFGQDLISEKSLDEVILAYLSEDGSED